MKRTLGLFTLFVLFVLPISSGGQTPQPATPAPKMIEFHMALSQAWPTVVSVELRTPPAR